MQIGILALQGNYYQHKRVLNTLGIQSKLIRYAHEFKGCSALIIPGGESTTISKQIDNNKLRIKLKDFANNNPVLATCAGMIMLSSTIPTHNVIPLNIMDFQVKRNGWGRQVHSFSADINLDYDTGKTFHAVFIRAPKITRIVNGIKVLSSYEDAPVLITNGIHIASSFHPEIGNDFRIHKYFINKVNERISALI